MNGAPALVVFSYNMNSKRINITVHERFNTTGSLNHLSLVTTFVVTNKSTQYCMQQQTFYCRINLKPFQSKLAKNKWMRKLSVICVLFDLPSLYSILLWHSSVMLWATNTSLYTYSLSLKPKTCVNIRSAPQIFCLLIQHNLTRHR